MATRVLVLLALAAILIVPATASAAPPPFTHPYCGVFAPYLHVCHDVTVTTTGLTAAGDVRSRVATPAGGTLNDATFNTTDSGGISAGTDSSTGFLLLVPPPGTWEDVYVNTLVDAPGSKEPSTLIVCTGGTIPAARCYRTTTGIPPLGLP